jgi:hypothetical protein
MRSALAARPAASFSFWRSMKPGLRGSGDVSAELHTTCGFQSQRPRSSTDTIWAVWPQAWITSGRNCFVALSSWPKAPPEKRWRDSAMSCTGTPFWRSTAAGTACGASAATCALTRCFGMRVSSGMNSDCWMAPVTAPELTTCSTRSWR